MNKEDIIYSELLNVSIAPGIDDHINIAVKTEGFDDKRDLIRNAFYRFADEIRGFAEDSTVCGSK